MTKKQKDKIENDPILKIIYTALETCATREIGFTFAMAERVKKKIEAQLPNSGYTKNF